MDKQKNDEVIELKIDIDSSYTDLCIAGIDYKVNLLWTLEDYMEFSNIDDESEEECKAFIRKKIIDAIVDKKQIEQIATISDSDMDKYCQIMLDTNQKFAKEYDNLAKEYNRYIRFVKAGKEENNRLKNEIRKSMESVIDVIETVSKSMTEAMTKNLQIIVDSFKIWSDTYTERFWKSISNSIKKIVSSIKIPEIDEQRKQEILDNYKKWGEYGWTCIPDENDFLFSTEVSNKKEADRMAMEYISDEVIIHIFNELEKMKAVKKSDLRELKSCFEARSYKACCMIAFAMLEAKLARLSKNRATGMKGIKALRNKVENETNVKNTFFFLLHMENLNYGLSAFFENGNNFVKQPEVINRNFINHGMMHRKVYKRDAIQVILVTYNLYQLLEIMNGAKNDRKK